MSLMEIAAFGALSILLLTTACWLFSVKFQDSSLVDRIWGLGFIVCTLTYICAASEWRYRAILTLTLVVIWGLRLSIHIHLRNRGKGEDFRYRVLRKRYGRTFWWRSYTVVFLTQGTVMFVVSSPILMIMNNSGTAAPTVLDLVGLLLFTIGFYFETVGDHQLKQFRLRTGRQGKILDTGLWSLTRHPNYFGEALIWWGFYVIAWNVPSGIVTVFSPLLMTYLLINVTGVALLEKNLQKKPGYKEYMQRVPPFFPRCKFNKNS